VKFGITFTARLPVHNGDSFGAKNGSYLESPADDSQEEFDPPETIAAIAEAIKSLGHEVELLGDGPELVQRLVAGPNPEFVFNIAEGRGVSRSREAWAPAILEVFEIPYTGSDPHTLAVTLDKHTAKQIVRAPGVAVPKGILVREAIDQFAKELSNFQLPAIVKPAYEGSSKGIRSSSLISDREQLAGAVDECIHCYQQPAIVEEFIDGEEITVGICGNSPPEVIGIMRIVPQKLDGPFVYSLDVKRDWRRQVRYEAPAQFDPTVESAVRKSALAAFAALSCRDVCRIDFRLRDSVPYFLEANPLPGLSPGTSDLVLLAEGCGIGYRELIARIISAAVARHQSHLVPQPL
jgi:D-alanine-D-alanine ligase